MKDEKPKLPVGVSMLITCGDKILLGERIGGKAAGLLSTPGGRIEENEDVFHCAMRETFEEIGVYFTHNDFAYVGWKEYFRFDMHYFMFYLHATLSVQCALDDGVIVNKEPEECKGWVWVEISTLEQAQTTEPLEIVRTLKLSHV